MSAGGAFGGARGYQPRAPEKGVFPLDHFGECKTIKDAYLKCLKSSAGEAETCREYSKQYLECRMERNLMAPQDLRELGFNDGKKASVNLGQAPHKENHVDEEQRKRKGFVAGSRT